jgi:hypothetical protein
MTPEEWARCDSPQEMLQFLWTNGKDHGRSWTLFTVACSRRMWSHLTRGCHRVVETAERLVDGQADREELERVVRISRGLPGWSVSFDGWLRIQRTFHVPVVTRDVSASTVLTVAEAAIAPPPAIPQTEAADWLAMLCKSLKRGRRSAERRGQCALLRCIFNPFSPSCLHQAVPTLLSRLAEAAYEERKLPEGTLEPGRIGVLGDALEESGLVDEGLLAHLRGPGPHVRGCHAVDALLGRTTP